MSNKKELIFKDELVYENCLNAIADRVCNDKKIKIILITGGSCAGKTTTTRKLSQLITAGGREAHTISLDDYYRNVEESVYLPDGTRDIESINSLRLDLIRENMSDLLSGREASIPFFDFKTKCRTDDYRRLQLTENDVVLVEGLHALSPQIFPEKVDESAIYRVYLYADAGDGADCRFVRRMVRDARHRNANAQQCYEMWHNVKLNEGIAIEPFEKYADIAINTFFPYERHILNDDAVRNLKAISADSKYYSSAQKLISILEGVEQWSDELIPENSLLHEFI